VLACIICSASMESHEPTVYLQSGAVAHLPCRRSSSGAVGRSVAIVRPSTQAIRLRARELHADARAKRAEPKGLTHRGDESMG
jgi:hypothetical protein